jgi:hypothetical protein
MEGARIVQGEGQIATTLGAQGWLDEADDPDDDPDWPEWLDNVA